MAASIRTKLLRSDRQKFILDHTKDDVPDNVVVQLSRLCEALHATSIPEDWQWCWLVSNGKHRGKMPSRLRKLCGVKRLAAPIENILTKTREQMPKKWMYVLDVTFTIDWKDGAFGDGGSCYWLGDKSKIDIMNMCGFGALRRWKLPRTLDLKAPDAKSKLESRLSELRGYGRTWLAPDVPERGMLTIYNAYPSGWYIDEAAEIFCETLPRMTGLLDVKFVHCQGYIEPTGNSNIYLNGSCRIVGTETQLEQWDGFQDNKKVRVKLERMRETFVYGR